MVVTGPRDGSMFQHQAVSRRSDLPLDVLVASAWDCLPSSQTRNWFSCERCVKSGRFRSDDAPHARHNQR